MNIIVPKRIIPATLLLLAGVFLFSSIFGSMHTFAMEMEQDAPMNECVLIGMGKDCAMNPLEHITLWQSFFDAAWTGVFAGTALVTLFMLALIIITPRILRLFTASLHLIKQKLYQYTSKLTLIPPLQEAFSQGILNPKTY